jgi:hypothetical protein
MPSSTRNTTTAQTPMLAAAGVKTVQTTLMNTLKNITHLAENFPATTAPGI